MGVSICPEKRSSLLEVGNTPKATSVARVVLQRMTRKSLLQNIQDSEQNPTLPSNETKLKHTSPSQSQQRLILPDAVQEMTSVNQNKQNEKAGRSTRLVLLLLHQEFKVLSLCSQIYFTFNLILCPDT